MRVLFDARRSVGRATGIGRIVDGLLHALAEDDCANQYLVLVGDHDPLAGVDAPNFEVRRVAAPLNSPWTKIAAVARSWHADVAYFPFWLVPLRVPCPFVVAIHDLIPILQPEGFTLPQRTFFRTYTRLIVSRARRLHVLAGHGRDMLQEVFGVAPDRIDVVPPAVPDSFDDAGPGARNDASAAAFPEPFALYVGNHKSHKNLDRLLRAYAGVNDRIESHLVVAGAKSSHADPDALPHLHAIEELGLQGRVHFAGQVSDAVLHAMYKRARFFVFPSLYEGFGMPALEAMRCGTPVACSNTTSLPEVVGDAALTFDPLDERAIGEAMLRLDQGAGLRGNLACRGLARSRQFSWKASAHAWLASMTKAAGN